MQTKPRGRPPKAPGTHATPKPRSAYARWNRKPRPPEPTPTPEQHARARELLAAWAEAGGWPAPRPGWQSALARRLGVTPGMVSQVWGGRRVMPGGWVGRLVGDDARGAAIVEESPAILRPALDGDTGRA